MPPMNPQNLVSASTDLGLGDVLANQMQDQVAEMKKKKMQQNAAAQALGTNPMGGAAEALGLGSGQIT